MDITDFIFAQREDVLLAGDYNGYRAHATRKLHKLRKKLGQTTPKGRKYTAKPPVSAENINNNVAYVHILLLSSERAWAQAMHMKSAHSADPSAKGIVGAVRRQIISRLNKATGYAKQLVLLLEDQAASGATSIDVLEARAYLATLSGALCLDKRQWKQCVEHYSIAKVIYTALGQKSKRDAFRDLLSSTVDPSLRYAAYQMKLPRSKPLPSLAIGFFPADAHVRAEVEKVDPNCFNEEAAGTQKTADGGVQQLPENITWRSRTVPLEDAAISQALAAAAASESRLTSWLADASGKAASSKDKAAAYDNVIIASQDAVDATKTAIDDLAGEGVDPGDKRMQSLQVTRTAVNYALVGWRIGRNRVLCGEQDGISFEADQIKSHKSGKSRSKHDDAKGKKLGRLRERVVLYDSTLQSIEYILELPGVAADTAFVKEMEVKSSYFRALRCLSIGRSHGILGKSQNALALYSQALTLSSEASGTAPASDAEGPPRIDVSRGQFQTLVSTLQGLVAQYRGLVTLEKLSEAQQSNSATPRPAVERLHEYSGDGLDLANLVPYPPQMQPIPVKPLFLDVAWNYIDYPREGDANQGATQVEAEPPAEEKKGGRRGWFGFGR
ncbi:signal recognition particle subunit SRP68 [Aspergillus melleus]|uniref:signal recognition particle subunit SRP68 n=1 Tax=Aspergillus melleus TaxID=138277 RepID=UPI001E8DB6F4|nr:signal recognition particle subunit srp68 [Aspergillus melleus]KAH8428067.1 signal recognition particle subunit srp68 [Aspergillus melleus]